MPYYLHILDQPTKGQKLWQVILQRMLEGRATQCVQCNAFLLDRDQLTKHQKVYHPLYYRKMYECQINEINNEDMSKWKEPLTYYRREPFFYQHFGDYYFCPMGCPESLTCKKGELKQHLCEVHSDSQLRQWGYSRRYLKFELD